MIGNRRLYHYQRGGAPRCLLSNHFYEDAVGQFAFQQVNYAAFHIALEDLAGGSARL
jgi:hypothetical protein